MPYFKLKSREVANQRIAAVTGGTGTIGRHIVRLLLEQNWQVRILSRGLKNIDNRADLITGSLADSSALLEFVDGVEAVFHCAAEILDESRMWEVNVKGTANLLQALAGSSLNCFCHISSAIVVGPACPSIITEKTECRPQTEYEKTKWESEQLVYSWNGCDKICILRPTDGIDADSPGILKLGIRNSLFDRARILLQGAVNAHVIHVEDIAAAALFFVDREFKSPGCFFVACDEDELNTVAGIYSLCRSELTAKKQKAPYCLPAFIPGALRRSRRGKSLHVKALFSSAQLKKHGFRFPYGLRGGIKNILNQLCDAR